MGEMLQTGTTGPALGVGSQEHHSFMLAAVLSSVALGLGVEMSGMTWSTLSL